MRSRREKGRGVLCVCGKKGGLSPCSPLFFIECECVFARVKKRERECVCRVGAWGGHTFLIKIKKRGNKKTTPFFKKNYSANSPSSPSPSPRSSAATAPSASAGPNAR